MKDIDADYYGYRDEDDGVLTPLEKDQEKITIAQKMVKYREKKEAVLRGEVQAEVSMEQGDEDIYNVVEEEVGTWD